MRAIDILTIGIVPLIRKIRQSINLNNAFKKLNGANPLDTLFDNDTSKRQIFESLIEEEKANHENLSSLGKIKHFFSNEEKPSTAFLRQYHNEKTKKFDDALITGFIENNGYNNAPIKENASKAKSAYKLLKTSVSREKYDTIKIKEFNEKFKAKLKNQQTYKFSKGHSSDHTNEKDIKPKQEVINFHLITSFFKILKNTQKTSSTTFQINPAKPR
jgi:hypothetical protein